MGISLYLIRIQILFDGNCAAFKLEVHDMNQISALRIYHYILQLQYFSRAHITTLWMVIRSLKSVNIVSNGLLLDYVKIGQRLSK